jgi:signal transduction histidine kinase
VKIGQRLALRFTLVSALLTGAILIITYVITSGVVHSDFIDRLSQQSRLEVLHYANSDVKEVVDPGTYLLVNPKIAIYSEEGKLLASHGEFDVPSSWVTYLQQNLVFNAERDGISSVGRKYTYGGITYLVFVSARDVSAHHELQILARSMIAGWTVSLVLSYLAGLYFAGNALQAVKHVVKDVNKITEDNLSYRLQLDKDLTSMDEIDELILTFNALLNRIESAFIAQKRFVQHASHELKTPLTAIMAEAELALAKDRNVDDYKRTLSVVLTETERLVSTTQGLLTLARLEEGSYSSAMENVDMRDVCNSMVSTIRLHHPERKIILGEYENTFVVSGNRQLLEIALLNILDNAIKYSHEEILVELLKDNKYVALRVRDKGVGIPSAELEKIRAPLYRGSNVNAVAGAGLGLSLVDRIVSVHGGSFQIESTEGTGTTCTVRLKWQY